MVNLPTLAAACAVRVPCCRCVRSTSPEPPLRLCGAGLPFVWPLLVWCGAPRRAKTFIAVLRPCFVGDTQEERALGLSVSAWAGGREEERRLGPEQARGPACASQVHGWTRG